MTEARIRVRANRNTGELEVEGSPADVAEWWAKLWPEVSSGHRLPSGNGSMRSSPAVAAADGEFPEIFGEFFSGFRSDVPEIDKILIAGAFVQSRDPDRCFTTKAANQLLIDQNIKVANASQSVRRLLRTKRAFVVSDGKFRVSTTGVDHLKTIKPSPQ